MSCTWNGIILLWFQDVEILKHNDYWRIVEVERFTVFHNERNSWEMEYS